MATLDEKISEALDKDIPAKKIREGLKNSGMSDKSIDEVFQRVLQQRTQEEPVGTPQAIFETAKDLVQPIIDEPTRASSTAGMLIGGGLAGVPGAIGGAAIGESLGMGAEVATGSEIAPKTVGEGLGRVGTEGALAVLGEGFGKGAMAVKKAITTGFRKKSPETISQFLDAAAKAGIAKEDLPLSSRKFDSPRVGAQEATLARKGSAAGTTTTEKVRNFALGLNKLADDIKKGASFHGRLFTKSEFGEAARNKFLGSISKRSGPISKKFDLLEEAMADLKLDPNVNMEVVSNLSVNAKRADIVGALGSSFKEGINELTLRMRGTNSLGGLKKVRTVIGEKLQQKLQPEERRFWKMAYKEITDYRNEQMIIKTKATKGLREASDLKALQLEADREWSVLQNDVTDLMKGVSGRAKPFKNISEVETYLENMRDDQFHLLVDNLWKRGNVRQLDALRKASPDAFEIFRTAKLQDIFENATVDLGVRGKQLNGVVLAEQFSGLSDDSVQILFGEKPKDAINALRILVGETAPELRTITGRAAKEGGNVVITENPPTIAGEAGEAVRLGTSFIENNLLSFLSDSARMADSIVERIMPFRAPRQLKQTVTGQVAVVPTRFFTMGMPTVENKIDGFDAADLIMMDSINPQLQAQYLQRLKNAARGSDPEMDSAKAAKLIDLFNKRKAAPLSALPALPGQAGQMQQMIGNKKKEIDMQALEPRDEEKSQETGQDALKSIMEMQNTINTMENF